MKKTLYFNQGTNKMLVEMSASLNKSMSEVIQIALTSYREQNERRAEEELRKCSKQLSESIQILEISMDYNEGATNPDIWTDKDEEIHRLLWEAYNPIMNYNNAKIRMDHPDWFDEDGDLINTSPPQKSS